MANNLHVYDLANWRPVSFADFVKMLGEMTLIDSKEQHINKIEMLHDGRVRTVFKGELKDLDDPSQSFEEPYLMHLFDPETGTSVCFHRNDVVLAHM